MEFNAFSSINSAHFAAAMQKIWSGAFSTIKPDNWLTANSKSCNDFNNFINRANRLARCTPQSKNKYFYYL